MIANENSSNQTPVLALQDSEGRLYLLTMDMIQQARVPDEQAQTMLQALNSGDEVNGYAWTNFLQGAGSLLGIPSPTSAAASSVSSAANQASSFTNAWASFLMGPLNQASQTQKSITSAS